MLRLKLLFITIVYLCISSSVVFAQEDKQLVLAVERGRLELILTREPVRKKGFLNYHLSVYALDSARDLSGVNAFVLEGPDRFVLDVPGAFGVREESIYLADEHFAMLRFGPHSDRSRIVLDLDDGSVFSIKKRDISTRSFNYEILISSNSVQFKGEQEVFVANDEVSLNIPSVEELESYLSPGILKHKDGEVLVANEFAGEHVQQEAELPASSGAPYVYLAVFIFACVAYMLHRRSLFQQRLRYSESFKKLQRYKPQVAYARHDALSKGVSLAAFSLEAGEESQDEEVNLTSVSESEQFEVDTSIR